jgi:hypothetical protein
MILRFYIGTGVRLTVAAAATGDHAPWRSEAADVPVEALGGSVNALMRRVFPAQTAARRKARAFPLKALSY